MNWLSFAVVLSALLGLTISHEYDETIDTQQPFVGWTKDDLNAKWGTDERHLIQPSPTGLEPDSVLVLSEPHQPGRPVLEGSILEQA